MAKPKKTNLNKSFDSKKSNPKSTTSSSLSVIQKPKPKPKNNPEGFKFISNTYSIHLECPICSQLMIRPMRIHPCGHTFCQKCIEPILSLNKKVCPYDNCLRKFQITQNDRTAENLIDQLKVQCTNEPCVYKGLYDHYKKHHKDTCAFRNGGIDAWLGNLTSGLVLTQRASQIVSTNDNDEFTDRNSKIKKLEKPIQEYQNQDSQQIGHIQNEEQLEECQNKNQQQKKYRKDQKKQENDGQKRKKQQEKEVSNAHSLNNTSSDSGGDLNFSIFRIPFGPSIREQIESDEVRKKEFMQKEIKKIKS